MYKEKCPRCGGEIRCLGGSSAHPNNWYCEDETGCGWKAWDEFKDKETDIEELFYEIEKD